MNKQEGTEKISRDFSFSPFPFGGKYFCPQNARFTKMLAKLHVTPSKAAAHAGLNWPSCLTNRPALLWAGPSLLPAARVPRETRGSAVQVLFPYRKGSSSSRTYINSLNPLLHVHLRRVQLVIPKGRVCSGISSYFRGSKQRFLLRGLSPASSIYNQRDALGC